MKSRGYIGFEYYDQPFSHKNELWLYTINSPKIDQKFIYYYLLTQTEKLQRLAKATSVKIPQLSVSDTDKLTVPIPPLIMQKEIVKILDTFTELEAELEAREKQYEYYRDELLKLNRSIRNVRLGDISSYSKDRISADKLNLKNYIGVDNLLQNKKGKTHSTCVPSVGNFTKYDLDDVLIGNIRPYLKKIWQAKSFGGTNGDVLVIRINEDEKKNINARFLYHWLASDSFFNFNMKFDKGAKMPRGDKVSIMNFKIFIPSLSEQKRIVSILDKFDALVNDISVGLPAELNARRKQYEYYREKLLTFREKEYVEKQTI